MPRHAPVPPKKRRWPRPRPRSTRRAGPHEPAAFRIRPRLPHGVDQRRRDIEKVHGVDESYSDDDDVRRLADADGVAVGSVADLPLPPWTRSSRSSPTRGRNLPEPGAAAVGNAVRRGDSRDGLESRVGPAIDGQPKRVLPADRQPARQAQHARIFWRLGDAGGLQYHRRSSASNVWAASSTGRAADS